MHIQKIDVKNFRLLKDVNLFLDQRTTVIIGRNNSGKTSLAELFRRLLSENSPAFNLEDFSLGVHEQFWTAFTLKQEGREETDIREELPVIEVTLTLSYNENDPGFSLLSDFIIDLESACTEALIVFRYQLEDGKLDALFKDVSPDQTTSEIEQKAAFFRVMKERIPKFYKPTLLAVDPIDPTNKKSLDWPKLRTLLQAGFINAQRGLDDTTHRDNDVLGKILEVLFSTAMSDSADPKDRQVAQNLKAAVQTIQGDIDTNFNEQLMTLLPAFNLFGYPGLPDPNLRTETILDVERLLKNHTKIRYPGANSVYLPEGYNGLGARNLIFILLKLLEFFKLFMAKPIEPCVNLVFIEEPEAHLHPQMQEVFINKLSEISNTFVERYRPGQPWPVQFVVTTHSSHMANKASFDSMRYFVATAESNTVNSYVTKIKDLKRGFSDSSSNIKFLHKYMTLTRCDLLFADKAVLIEGTTERLLMPKMIEKVDENQSDDLKLSSQYISVMEVGGAYAHIFFKLLEFLELRTLIITDLDAIDHNDSRKACMVSKGTRTSNACITTWFTAPDIEPKDLINKALHEKTNGVLRLAYQVPEALGKPCGRSFEDAFILANSELFELKMGTTGETEEEAWTKAKDVKKSEFALDLAINRTEWTVPLYIKEGLAWLAENPNHPATSRSTPSDEAPKEA